MDPAINFQRLMTFLVLKIKNMCLVSTIIKLFFKNKDFRKKTLLIPRGK